MQSIEPILQEHLGSVSYLSRASRISVLSFAGRKKDVILESTQSPVPLLHVQCVHCAQQGCPKPLHVYTHMFCIPVDDPLIKELSHQETYSSATLYSNPPSHGELGLVIYPHQ